MQLHLFFKGENISLPLSHKYEVQGLIYKMLSADGDYSTFLHNTGYLADSKAFKLFCFGDLRGKYIIKDKRIVFTDGFELQIRSYDPAFIQAVLSSAEKKKAYSLCENRLMLSKCTLDNRIVFDEAIRIKTLSPVTVYETLPDGSTQYFSPDTEEFYSAIIRNCVAKARLFTDDIDLLPFDIAPASAVGKIKKTVTKYKNIYINSWGGEFTLCGPPQLLDLLYNVGLGAKNSQGFGMFEIV